MRSALFILLLYSVIGIGNSYHILGLFPVQCKSHFIMFERLLIALAERGHQVDVVSHFPQKTPIPRYKDLSVLGSVPLHVNNVNIESVGNLSHYELLEIILKVFGTDACKAVLNTQVAKDLKHSSANYDLIITEIFGSDCMLGFAHIFKVPVISMVSSVDLPWASDNFGNPDNPSYIPNYFVPYGSKMSFIERFINTVVLVGIKVWYNIRSMEPSHQIARDFFGQDLPDLKNLVYNTSLLLINSHFSINSVRPTLPNCIEVGGLHIGEEKPLPKHLDDLLKMDPKYKGTIYISMGSMVLIESFPTPKLQAMFDAFAELPYKVLWKLDKTKLSKDLTIPPNNYFEKWLPQLDILCHPNVKLFITHGGLMGTQEYIHCGVPSLGIPLFADQELNIQSSVTKGVALKVSYNNITKETILTSARELLGNPKYMSNAKKLSKQFRDRPLSALDTAIYWVEYVITHNGAPHLRSGGADLPWYQYYLVDVGVILCFVVLIALSSIYFIIRTTLRLLLPTSGTKIFKND